MATKRRIGLTSEKRCLRTKIVPEKTKNRIEDKPTGAAENKSRKKPEKNARKRARIPSILIAETITMTKRKFTGEIEAWTMAKINTKNNKNQKII